MHAHPRKGERQAATGVAGIAGAGVAGVAGCCAHKPHKPCTMLVRSCPCRVAGYYGGGAGAGGGRAVLRAPTRCTRPASPGRRELTVGLRGLGRTLALEVRF
jgi:hypothetical protein